MNTTVAKKWVDALRSGKFRQGRTYLHHPLHPDRKVETFCCLGVLCELAVAEGVIFEPSQYEGNDMEFYYDGNNTALGTKVRHWAGLTLAQEGVLMDMNDTKNKSFDQIAYQIEVWINEPTN